MRDPFAHQANAERDKRLGADPQVRARAPLLIGLRIGTGLLALALLAAVWLIWRWG